MFNWERLTKVRKECTKWLNAISKARSHSSSSIHFIFLCTGLQQRSMSHPRKHSSYGSAPSAGICDRKKGITMHFLFQAASLSNPQAMCQIYLFLYTYGEFILDLYQIYLKNDAQSISQPRADSEVSVYKIASRCLVVIPLFSSLQNTSISIIIAAFKLNLHQAPQGFISCCWS